MNSPDRGTVFVESIIAAAIVAMALGTTFEIIADGAKRDRSVEAHQLALLVAQSQLADVGADIPLATGRTTGLAGGYAWQVDVSSYAAEGGSDSVGALWKIDVAVHRQGGAALARLSSLRLDGED